MLLALVCASSPGWAAGLWVWKDDSGRKVFSDTPPPAHVPNGHILQQPNEPSPQLGPSPELPVRQAAEPTKPTVQPKPAPQTAASQTAEAPRQSEEAQRATERRNAEIRADNCQRAQASLVTVKAGGRLATVNADGQRIIMDPAMRNAEQARLEQIVADNCR